MQVDRKIDPIRRVEVKVVDSNDELMLSLMIRSAVYVGEDGRLLTEEADGNDFSATHVIARVDGKPAGTVRIRYFGDFAILERMAVLKPYRLKRFGSRGVAWELGEYAFQFCRLKGYTRFYGLAREGLVDFWRRFAPDGATFEPIPGAVVFNGEMRGFPMDGFAPPLPYAVSGMDDHAVLKRRESDLPLVLTAAAAPLPGVAPLPRIAGAEVPQLAGA